MPNISSIAATPTNLQVYRLKHKPIKRCALWDTISHLFRHIIRVLSFGRLCNPILKKAHIQVINKFKEKKIIEFPHINQSSKVDSHGTSDERKFNSSIEGMRNFGLSLVLKVVECIQIKYINPKVDEIENHAHQIPELIKKYANEAIKWGSLSAKPIFDLIGQLNVNEQAFKQLNRIIEWALKDIAPTDKTKRNIFIDTYGKKILDRMGAEEFVAEKVTKQQGERGIQTITRWIFDQNYEVSIYDYVKKASIPFSDKLVLSILQTTLQQLAEDKINLYKEKISAIFYEDTAQSNPKSKLKNIIENSLKENATSVTNLLTERLGIVLDKLGDDQFTILFDKIIEIVGKHVTHIAESQETALKIAQEHQDLKKRAEEIIQRVPKNAAENVLKKQCEEYLKNAEKKGGIPGIQEEVFFKTFLALSGHQNPSIDTHVIDDISRLILDIILPTHIKDGVKITGLENCLMQLKLPEEFSKLIEEAHELTKNILTEEQYKDTSGLFKVISEGSKEIALDSCTQMIKLGLNEALSQTLKHISKPEELYFVMSNSILPSAIGSMNKLFADDIIVDYLDHLAPYFNKLPNKQVKKELLNELFELAKINTRQYSFNEGNKNTFIEYVKPRINEIEELLQLVRKKDPLKSDIKSTKAVIQEYYKSAPHTNDNNPHFADLIDVGLRTGEFGKFLPSVFNLEKIRLLTSQLLTRAVQTYRTTPRPLINTSFPELQTQYVNEKVINEWIDYRPDPLILTQDIQDLKTEMSEVIEELKSCSNEERKPKEANLEKIKQQLASKQNLLNSVNKKEQDHQTEIKRSLERLPDQVLKISQLCYDLIFQKTKSAASFIGTFFLKKFLGPTAEKIQRTILSLFNTITSRQIYNQYLLDKIFLTSVSALHMAGGANSGYKPLLEKANQNELDELRIPLNPYSGSSRPVILPVEPMPIKSSIWKKIAQFIVQTFHRLFLCFNTKKIQLNRRQIHLIKSIESKKVEKDLEDSDAPDHLMNSRLEPASLEASRLSLSIHEHKKNHKSIFIKDTSFFNSSLRKANQFVNEFMAELSRGINRKNIDPLTDQIRHHSSHISEYIQKILHWMTEIISPIADTVVKKIVKKGYRFQLDHTSRMFFDSLFPKESSFEPELIKFLTAFNKQYHLAESDLRYIQPILAWLKQTYSHPKNIRSLAEFSDSKISTIDELILSKYYVETVQWLIKHKIEIHIERLQNFLQTDFTDILKSDLSKNMQSLTQLVFNRVAELINDISDPEYRAFFDLCVSKIGDQMHMLMKAEARVKERLHEHQKNDQEHLKSLVREELANHPSTPAHQTDSTYSLPPLAQKLLTIPANINAKDIPTYKIEEEKKFFLNLAERMIKLVLPHGEIKIDDKIVSIDALQELWGNIQLNPVFTEHFDQLKEFVQSLLPLKYINKIEFIKQKVLLILQKFIINAIKSQASKVLAEQLRLSFNNVSNDHMRKKLLNNSFPSIHQQLVRGFCKLICIKENLLNSYFLHVLIDKDSKTLAKQIQASCKNKFKFSSKLMEISLDEFIDLYMPYISSDVVNDFLKQLILSDSFKKLYPHLKNLINSPEDKPATMAINHWFLTVVLQTFHKENEHIKNTITLEVLSPITTAFIKSIAERLRDHQNILQRTNPSIELTDAEIYTFMNHHYNGENDRNLQYADLITTMMQMGRFGGNPLNDKKTFVEKILGKVKDFDFVRNGLTEVILPALHPLRTLDGMIDLSIDGLREKYLHNDGIRYLLETDTAPSEPRETTEAIFSKEIDTTAGLLYDLIEYSAGVAKTGWHAVAGQTPAHLSEVIKTLYGRLFSLDELNQALLVNVTQQALSLLESKNRLLLQN